MMYSKVYCLFLFVFVFVSCQQEDVFHNSIKDTFILVDVVDDVYNFVQIDNEYSIGVHADILNVDYQTRCGREREDYYYKFDMECTGLVKENYKVRYQRYDDTNEFYKVRVVNEHNTPVKCYVQKNLFGEGVFTYYSYYVELL